MKKISRYYFNVAISLLLCYGGLRIFLEGTQPVINVDGALLFLLGCVFTYIFGVKLIEEKKKDNCPHEWVEVHMTSSITGLKNFDTTPLKWFYCEKCDSYKSEEYTEEELKESNNV
jgi:hypothetical protein